MKNNYIIIGVLLLVVLLAFFFKSNKGEAPEVSNDGDTGTTLTDGSYGADLEASSIKWSIEYQNGTSEEGIISLKSGSLMVAKGEPFSGNFEIDMETLRGDSNIVLENFLKAENILDVEKYPTSKFVISRALPNPVSGTTTGKFILDGKLTVKGKENPVSFPVTFSKEGGKLVGVSSFAINKSEWGIDTKEIKNAVSIELNVVFSKE